MKKITLKAEDRDVLEGLLGRKIILRNSDSVNEEGLKKLKDQGRVNAQNYLSRYLKKQAVSTTKKNVAIKTLHEVKDKFGLSKFPERVECYDISHLQGKFVYGSMVVFINGLPNKKLYRLFKTKEQNNDFANLAEVLQRRIVKAKLVETGGAAQTWELPDLIVIDGGKGQLSSVQKIFEELDVEGVDVCSLAKRDETVYTEAHGDGVVLEGEARFLFQRVRDEAHRFAITNNRKARVRQVKKSGLDEIEGIGDVTKEKLLKTFGSLDNIVENLFHNEQLVVDCVGPSITAKLKSKFGIR